MVTLDSSESVLTKGIEVEVSSDDEGFLGAWYRATVLEPPLKSTSKKRKKALVEYKTLVTEDGFTPLTEYIDPAYIRPLPPQGEVISFDENDVVDAKYRDGWWTGIVRKQLLDTSKYRVYFDNPPDIIEFDIQDLRVHLDWRNGTWVRPHNQQTSGSIFSSGTAVEVNLDQDNLRDVWFPAIVLKENGDNSFLVKYQNSKNDDETGRVKVIVDSLHIRPTPPRYVDRNYELLERVDTAYDCGWRAGVITKVLAMRRYNVFFKHGNEDKELSHSEIRPHVEWIEGKWVSKSKEVLIASDNQEQLGHAHKGTDNPEVDIQLKNSGVAKHNTEEKTPCPIKVRKKWMQQSTPCHENSTSHALPPTKKKIKLTASNGNGVHSRPSKKLTEGNVAEVPLSVRTCQSEKMPKETSTKEALHSLATPKRGVAGTGYSKKPFVGNQPSAIIESPFMGKKVRTKRGNSGLYQTMDLVKSKGRPTKSQLLSSQASETVKEDNAVVAAADEVNDDDCKVKVAEMPVILGLQAKRTKVSEAESPCQLVNMESLKPMKDQKNNLDDSAGDKSMGINQQKVGGSSQRRKRGRPRKFPLASEAGKEPIGAGGSADKMIAKDRTSNEVELPTLTGVESTVSQKPSKVETAEVSEADCRIKDFDMAIAEVPNNMADDDQPLSTWIGVHSSTSVEELRLSSGRTNGCIDQKERQVAIVMESSAVYVKDCSVPDESQGLPFVKKSPVWKTIESMEVFQIVPQQPHFRPLAESKEEYREGSAIGIMVTFAGLFEKISMLRLDDPRSLFVSTLESLLDLEKHGFDVTVLQDRVNELLSVKDGQGQLLYHSRDAEREIMEHICEKTKFDGEMEEIKMKVTELEELYEAIRLKKENKDLEIARLRSNLDNMKERIQNAQSDFEKVATAPWKVS